MTQRRINVAPAGEPADADSFDPTGNVGDVLTKLAPPQPGAPPRFGWRPGSSGSTFTNLSDVVYVDGGTTVPPANRNGNIETPFATITAAIAALPNGGTVLATPGDYSGEGAIVGPNPPVPYALCNVLGEAIQPRNRGITFPFVIAPHFVSNSQLGFRGCIVADNGSIFTSNNALGMSGCSIETAITTQSFYASNCVFDLNAVVTVAHDMVLSGCYVNVAGTAFNLSPNNVCSITNTDMVPAIGVVIAFNAPGGLVQFDEYSYAQFIAANGAITNGVAVVIGRTLQARISVAVPAIAAYGVDYVDVATAGTPLENLPADTPIIVNPTADLAAAGATHGGFLNARVLAGGHIRCAFVGILAGGAVDFVFTAGG
jgi:hypothetical protein